MTFEVGSLTITAGRVHHIPDSFAFRIAPPGGGAGLVYTGDCGRATDIDPLVRPGDSLLSEVSFGPGPGDPGAAHLDGPSVGALATRTGVSRVLLTHLGMRLGEGRDDRIGLFRVQRPGRARRAGHGDHARLTAGRPGAAHHMKKPGCRLASRLLCLERQRLPAASRPARGQDQGAREDPGHQGHHDAPALIR